MASSMIAIKSRLEKGDILDGQFLCSFSPVIAEISGYAGYDFVVVDMEHGYGGISAALPCLQALAATGTPAILRLPELSQTWAKKALDLGPQGIMFPMIDTPELARRPSLTVDTRQMGSAEQPILLFGPPGTEQARPIAVKLNFN